MNTAKLGYKIVAWIRALCHYYNWITYRRGLLWQCLVVELPEEGDELTSGDSFGSVESVKTVSELYAPLSGKVVEVNDELEDSPEYVNESSYDKAWMVKVELTDKSQLDDLLDADAYSEMIGE